ncbi:MAG: hypothetical protein ABEI13_04465 [Candidatus Paceibacteria bacterium]
MASELIITLIPVSSTMSLSETYSNLKRGMKETSRRISHLTAKEKFGFVAHKTIIVLLFVLPLFYWYIFVLPISLNDFISLLNILTFENFLVGLGILLPVLAFTRYRPDRWLAKTEYIIGSHGKKVRRKRKIRLRKWLYNISSTRLKLRKFLVKTKLTTISFIVIITMAVTQIIYYHYSLSTNLIFQKIGYQIEIVIAAGSLAVIVYIFITNYINENLETVAAEIYLVWSVLGLKLVIVGSIFLINLKLFQNILSNYSNINVLSDYIDIFLLPVAATTVLGLFLSVSSMAKFPLYGGIMKIQEKLAKKAIKRKKNAEKARYTAKIVVDNYKNSIFREHTDKIDDSLEIIRADDINISVGSNIHDIKLTDSPKEIDELILHIVPGDEIQSSNQPIASCDNDADLKEIKYFLESRISTRWKPLEKLNPNEIDDSDIISDYLSKLESKCGNAIEHHHSRVISYCISKYVSLIHEYRIHGDSKIPNVDRDIEAIESLLRVYNLLEEEKQNNPSLDKWNQKYQNKIEKELHEIRLEIDDKSSQVYKMCNILELERSEVHEQEKISQYL